MRMPSPAAATGAPAMIDEPVGAASQNTSTPNRKPSATRKRAKKATADARRPRRSGTTRPGQTSLDGGHHLVYLNVLETHRLQPALPQMVALANISPRHRDITGRPWTVARRARRPIDADDRRAQSAGNVRRPRVARHEKARAPRERSHVGDRRLRQERRRAGGAVGDLTR